jgi:hypothetical protein
MSPTVTPADIKHRQEFKDFVIAHADAVYKPILRQLYGLWDAYRCFGIGREKCNAKGSRRCNQMFCATEARQSVKSSGH